MGELQGDYDFDGSGDDSGGGKAVHQLADPSEDMKRETNASVTPGNDDHGSGKVDGGKPTPMRVFELSSPYDNQQTTGEAEPEPLICRLKFSMILVLLVALYVAVLTVVGVLTNFRHSTRRYWTGPIAVVTIAIGLLWVALVYLIRRSSAKYDRVVEVFVTSFCLAHPLFVVQVLLSLGVSYGVAFLYQQTHIMAVRWVMFIVLVLGLTVFFESIPEEILKFLMVWRVRNAPDFNNRYGCVILGVSASMGVGVCTCMWDLILTYWGIYVLPQNLAVWAIERLLPGLILHLVTGMWIGLGTAKRYFPRAGKQRESYLGILGVPCLIHALYELFFNSSIVLFQQALITYMQWLVVVVVTVVALMVVAAYSFYRIISLLQNPGNYTVMTMYDDGAQEMP